MIGGLSQDGSRDPYERTVFEASVDLPVVNTVQRGDFTYQVSLKH